MSSAWYQRGLAFECTQCGACCRTHGEHSYVYLTDEEFSAIAVHLALGEPDFMEQFCETDSEGYVSLLVRPGDCVLLDEQGRCRAYPVRPKQCATWPFWTENLEPAVWNHVVKKLCPGVGRGRIHSFDEICQIARERDIWYGIERA